MDTNDLFEGYRILLSEESQTRLQLFEKWLPDHETHTAESPGAFLEQVDDHTVVACLSRPLFGEDEPRIRKAILSRNPHCQLIALLPHGGTEPALTREYDAYLRRPVYRQKLQETIETQLKYGVYSHTLAEFYKLNAHLARFGRTQADARRDTNVDAKRRRYNELKGRLDALQAQMDATDLDAIIHSLKRHNQHRSEPAEDTQPTQDSKYHPSRCPHCKLPWGVNHRNALGTGVERVGAYVWKCTRCSEITHGLGTSHRNVFR